MSLNSLKEEEETTTVILCCPPGYSAALLGAIQSFPKGKKNLFQKHISPFVSQHNAISNDPTRI